MYPSYYEFSYALEDAGVVLLPVLLTRGVPTVLIGIAGYVLTALALYIIAKRRCINHPWLAWVPVANLWLLGSLSDQYRYVVKDQFKSKRKLLLILKVVSVCLTVSVLAMAVAVVAKGIAGANYGLRGDAILESVLGSLLVTAGIGLALLVVNIALAVIRYMALYDVYTSCDPDNNVLFLVLSILFGSVAEPIFLLLSRNKDLGMPPRRDEVPWETPPENQYPMDPDDPLGIGEETEYL